MATQTDPVQQLAAVVSQLYDLSGNSQVPAAQQQALLLQANDLRGDLVTLVSVQLSQSSAGYQTLMQSLGNVTNALSAAQTDISKVVGVVSGAAQLATAIDNLLKQAVQIGAAVAKA
jgi:hypothetical protein